MPTKLASDDDYSETLWWTMKSGGGVMGVPEAWINMQKGTETNNVFYRATKAVVLKSSPRVYPLCIFCMSLFVNTPAH